MIGSPAGSGGARRIAGRALLAGACTLALGLGCAGALAQGIPGFTPADVAAGGEAQMVLEADQLVYDFDARVVRAVGNVNIFYKGNRIQAGEVAYDQGTGRLVASGGVRITQPDGTVITTEAADVTDDYAEGFIESLNIVTPDRTRFAAASAERRDGAVTILNRGVYTACEPCRERPERPPLWQIKAGKIIHDGKKKMIYYEDASLEFFGVPIAYVPYFVHPDPSKKRQSGFLTPRFVQRKELGFGVRAPYYWALAPNYDVTFTPTAYTQQGLHGELEWRHRLINGAYQVRVTGIRQEDPTAFDGKSGDREFRGSVQTSGEFAVAPRWRAGWDLTATSDRTYGRDYSIPDATALDVPSTVYLNGMSERNWFDLRGYHFRVQREDTVEADRYLDASGIEQVRLYEHDDQAEQAVVHPVLDHAYLFEPKVLGGELRSDTNVTSLSREMSDLRTAPLFDYYNGVAGDFTRASNMLSWRRRTIGPAGQVFTPFAYLRTDLFGIDSSDPATGLYDDDLVARVMPAVGLDYSWPILISMPGGTQTISPMAQIIARPDEAHVDDLPNDDAQSLVFDDTVLFSPDKFSGWDRVEGGTRANLGLAYQARFDSGVSIDALIGQSFHLAGENSYARPGVARTGLGSGLETERSDYVARVTLGLGEAFKATGRTRFDDESLELNRGELNAIYTTERHSAGVGYVYLEENPEIGVLTPRHEASTTAKLGVVENWSVLGGATFDLEEQARVSSSLGLAYDDECFNLSAVYSETRDRYTDLVTNQQVLVRVNLRTVGGTEYSRRLFGDDTADPAAEDDDDASFVDGGLLSNF